MPKPVPKRATMVLDHMKENYNFLTFSEASASKNEIEKLKFAGLIVIGVCSGGMLDGVEGYVIANPDRKTTNQTGIYDYKRKNMETQNENSGDGGGVGTKAVETAFPDDITQIGDSIATLTYEAAKELREYLKTEYGIEAPDGDSDAVQIHPKIVDKEEVEVKTTFDVVLTAAGEKKINVIKVIRTITGLGIKESKESVEAAPKTVKENVPKDEAEKMKATIEAEGGKVELK